MKIDLLAKFSVTKQENINESRAKVEDIHAPGEEILLVYAHTRDRVWFTSKRLITLDVQGFTGSKKEYRIFPYSKITSFSIETAGTFDGDSDFKIWVSGVGVFGIKFKKSLNIKEVARVLSERVIG